MSEQVLKASNTANTYTLKNDEAGNLLIQKGEPGVTVATITSSGLSGGMTTTNPTIASGALTFPDSTQMGTASSLGGFKNKIINGSMIVAQRGGATLSGTFQYGKVDRWLGALAGTGLAGTLTQSFGGIATLSQYSLKFSGISFTSGYIVAKQRIEAVNVRDLNGKTVTAKIKVAHDYGVATNFSLGLYKPTSGSADSWAGGDTVIGSSTTVSVQSGTETYITASWTLGASDASNGLCLVLDHASATVSNKNVYVGDVQLEAGSVATPFESRSIGQELALCQRYYYAVSGGQAFLWQGSTTSGTAVAARVYLPVTMRLAPTVTATIDAATNFPTGSISASNIDTSGFSIVPTANATSGGYFRGSFTAEKEL